MNNIIQDKLRFDSLLTTVHDLKGPLCAILTATELLRDESLENREILVNKVALCAKSALSLIEDLLSARMINEGIIVIKPLLFSLDSVIQEVLSDFSLISQSRHISLIYKPLDYQINIFADRILIKRMLSNLVSNGLKFTNSGGTVEVSSWMDENKILLKISDTGVGIDPAIKSSLFEKFERSDSSYSIDGVGLGLFIVKGIVDAHGGEIEVISQPGYGSSFTVSFPYPQKN